MSYLMCYYFEYIPDININNIYHIDDNIYNNSFDNLIYIENNILHQNLFLCNNVFLYMIIIEKYNYKFELIQRITNLEKNINLSKEFILNLLTYDYYVSNNHYWKLHIKKISLNDLNDISLYNNIDNTNYYISKDQSHIINKNRIVAVNKDKNSKYYSFVYYKNLNKFKKIYLDYFNFMIFDSTIFDNNPNIFD